MNADTLLNKPLQVSGLVPLSTTDFPGQLSVVLFCQGCPWRCVYCHNPHLQKFGPGNLPLEEVKHFLQKRQGLLDAVVISGGEPTFQPGLVEAIEFCKTLGYKVGLHTAACNLSMLEVVAPMLDWVGFDLKTKPETYSNITGITTSGGNIEDALRLLSGSGISFEVRTTFHPSLISDFELMEMAELLKQYNVRNFALQLFRNVGCKSMSLCEPEYRLPGEGAMQVLRDSFANFTVRD